MSRTTGDKKPRCKDCSRKCISKLTDCMVTYKDCEDVKLVKLFVYYLYYAPGIESVHAEDISRELHEDVFNRMVEDRHFLYGRICADNNNAMSRELKNGELDGDAFCQKCKRYVCKKKRTTKGQIAESRLECFLRHIRNAIAHGRIYYQHGGNRIHIVFEDVTSRGNLSARIVCIRSDLEYWRTILTDARYKA